MVNVNKIFDLLDEKGIKKGAFCMQLDPESNRSYLYDVSRGKSSMSDELIRKAAIMLGTSYEYLTDQTDDPAMIEDSETVKASADFIRDSATKLLEQINDVKNLENIEEMTLKSEIVELLDGTHDIQTLKMIKAALEAAKKE